MPLFATASMPFMEEGYRRSLSSTHHTAAGVVAKASFTIRLPQYRWRVIELSGRTVCRRGSVEPFSLSSGGTRGNPGLMTHARRESRTSAPSMAW